MPRKKKLTAIDLFSGCGGLSLGLQRAGFRILAAIDNDDLATETYKKNHPRVSVQKSDIAKVSTRTIMQNCKLRPGELDLLAGCPPRFVPTADSCTAANSIAIRSPRLRSRAWTPEATRRR